MFNFTPPHIENVVYGILFTCTLLLNACTWKKPALDDTGLEPHPDTVPYFQTSLYYNNDSLMEYARRAYLEDDAAALCVTGAAAYLHRNDSAARDTLSVVSLDEADIMLQRSAQLGCSDACRFIHYLDQMNLWKHSIPE